jgi:Zn-dependent peptidase ImmA (M78 family)/transcriptional regulator with XRE-family HTH domain
MSQRDLATQMGLSATAISKYEQGGITPNSGMLLRLAQALGIQVEFFLRPALVKEVVPLSRKRRALAHKDEHAVLAAIRDWLERYLEIETILSLHTPSFSFPAGFSRRVTTVEEIEESALDVREAWDLGLDPIESVTQLFEDKGIKVGIVEAEGEFDACTFMAVVDGRLPVIVVRKGLPGGRMRFNLAHELGHLLLETGGNLDHEKAAHRFAGALLVPEPVARFELGDRRRALGIYELYLLKHKYGMSMQAWVYRAKDLAIISEASFRRLNQKFRVEGWHKQEPGDPYPPEEPVRFERLVMQALAEGLISEKRAGELLGKPFRIFQREVAEAHGGLTVGLRYG